MKEIWKDVVGYEGYYEVSNQGRVRRLYRQRWKACVPKTHEKEKELAQWKVNRYPTVVLKKNGDKKFMSVHRLVAMAFLTNPKNLPEVNHKDETRDNNRVENLEWCTRKYNINYGTCIQRSVSHHNFADIAIKTAMTQTHGAVGQYDFDGNLVKTWISTNEPKRELGYNQGHIWECCKGKRRQAHGFIWKHIEHSIAVRQAIA